MMKTRNMIYRTKLFDRLCHAIVVICFILVSLSGLSLFFPSMHIFGLFFGTPQLGRILHPILGCIIFFTLAIMFFRFVKYNTFNKDDVAWLKAAKAINEGKHIADLPVGKYNAGQKFLFWGIMTLIITLFITGIVIWNQHFSVYFPIPIRRIALLVHSMAGITLIILILGHIYMAIWVKGTISSMITGYVPKLWAKTHHPLWYKKESEKEVKQE